uniref:Putative secreted protein n=1 Tax=Ixodes ricinus TaxID=34613 RepID=A0A6B0UBQ9_IXORI
MVYSHLRCLRSHTLMVLSSLPVARTYPLGEKDKLSTDLRWPSRNMMQRPVRRSQMRPKASIPPVAASDPSHWKLMS